MRQADIISNTRATSPQSVRSGARLRGAMKLTCNSKSWAGQPATRLSGLTLRVLAAPALPRGPAAMRRPAPVRRQFRGQHRRAGATGRRKVDADIEAKVEEMTRTSKS